MEPKDAQDGDTEPSKTSSSLASRRPNSFVYPIRSLLNPMRPSGGQDILDTLLSPSFHATQSPLSAPNAPSYFTAEPGAPEASITRQSRQSISSEEGYQFRHFPAEDATPSFTSAPPNKRARSFEDTPRFSRVDKSSFVPYQVQELTDSATGDKTVIKEIQLQAPQPTLPGSAVAQSLQDAVDHNKGDSAEGSEQGQSRNISEGGDQGTRRGSQSSSKPPSSVATSDHSFASAGLVHLPPIGKLDAQRRTREWRGKVAGAESSTPSSKSHPSSNIPPPIDEVDESTPEGEVPQPMPDGETSGSKNESFSVNTVSSHQSGPVVTMRFEHREDEDGHHVLVGREGTLTRCEDEPIRIPGAVQGFGVLIVLHDDAETGQLKVRQVSENSKVILGMSPKYLFGLDCFTNTLPPSQADLFWDNVQFLSDPDASDDDDEEIGPQVFLMSGWGEPGSAITEGQDAENRRHWTCWVAAHRLSQKSRIPHYFQDPATEVKRERRLIVVEFELESDPFNPLYPLPGTPSISRSDDSSPMAESGSGSASRSSKTAEQGSGIGSTEGTIPSDSTPKAGDGDTPGTTVSVTENAGDLAQKLEREWVPGPEAILDSTTNRARPLKSLERMRRLNRTSSNVLAPGAPRGNQAGIGTMDVFTVLQEINEQLGKALSLLQLLQIVVGVIKDLTQFHRVLCYQFDDSWNGQVVAELVDWGATQDLYMGLHFPAADIPAQARDLYALNRVRLLYDRGQSTARIVVKDRSDLEPPLDMTHCYLRAMSPIHLKYLGNMGVRASMSISIVAFQKLWGLIACHSYGDHGMRVSFPVRQMLRLLSDSISRNVERLSYAQRLRTRKLISTVPTDQHPTGYIVSNSEDLLTLFDADCGVLVIGEGAKILGPNEHGQDILLLAEYLRVKQFTLLQVSQSVMQDYPDLQLPSGLDVIAGLLYVPLSMTGKDFIALLRKGQAAVVNWAGKPPAKDDGTINSLQPRTSFKARRCRAWTDEQLDTAAVLALVYGKFIEVWRQKESAVQMNQMTTLLLSNASHEGKPIYISRGRIINYLELSLDGKKLDEELRENLTRSYNASKALLFTINDLLDLTRMEAGKETSFNEPFDLHTAIHDATRVYRVEANRRQLEFMVDLGNAPRLVIGDSRKVKTIVANLTSNAVKYTQAGAISVTAHTFEEPDGLRHAGNVAVEIIVSDTGCGIQPEKLESIFREFEQVDGMHQSKENRPGLGLGLAVVARVVEQLGGQLRVDSKLDQGSRFSCLLPFPLADYSVRNGSTDGDGSGTSAKSEIDSFVDAISSSHMMVHGQASNAGPLRRPRPKKVRQPSGGVFEVEDSNYPVRPAKVDEFDIDYPQTSLVRVPSTASHTRRVRSQRDLLASARPSLRILVVEDDLINARVLAKRLKTDGHTVETAVNGQQAVDLIKEDAGFDCILMDIQMPILDGFGATKAIREIEKNSPIVVPPRPSAILCGHIPIFAVSASLRPEQRPYMLEQGMDGWILKPIDFKRMDTLLAGISNRQVRKENAFNPGCDWEKGGWLSETIIPSPDSIETSPHPKSTSGSADSINK
ncbi:SubName: Full=Related to phytochrome {ECO:0000313/EMBL:CCA70880.1} [Serendipita indica DSM 11827]|nr:SubName: Full=Related to phytochrome {ECO:0000313/EMBL:CCA70880.1} [Serendipita indica DSM 11827]